MTDSLKPTYWLLANRAELSSASEIRIVRLPILSGISAETAEEAISGRV
jgi:hypothetical protein